MTRENIFDLVKANYDINKEIRKILDNLNQPIFYEYEFYSKEITMQHNFFSFCDFYLFEFFPEKGTCRNISEFLDYANTGIRLINFKSMILNKIDNEKIINLIEVVENVFFIYLKKHKFFQRKYCVGCHVNAYKETCFLLDEIEKHLGLNKLKYKDRVILYLDAPKLSQALKNVTKPELATELIKYKREANSSIEKRKILKQLDILTEPITDKIKKTYGPANDLDCIFNNFQLRHNNMDSNSHDYKEKVSQLKEKDLCKIYDIAYELVLDTLMLNDYDNYLKGEIIKYKSYL